MNDRITSFPGKAAPAAALQGAPENEGAPAPTQPLPLTLQALPAGGGPGAADAGRGPARIGRPGAPAAGAAGAAAAGSGARPAVMQLTFREKPALYAAYMPLVADGGLFVPTPRDYKLGDDIYLLVSLPDDNQRYPVAGKVCWITPANAPGGRTQGVGVRFPNDEKTRALRVKIEEILGTSISSAKPTQTL